MEYNGLVAPLSVQRFSTGIKSGAKAYGAEFITRLVKGVTHTNVRLKESAEVFLAPDMFKPEDSLGASPPAPGVEPPAEKGIMKTH
jgi:hypothetical protein